MAADPHWRHTANEVKLAGIDARAFATFPPLLIIKSGFLFFSGCILIIFFFIIDVHLGLNLAKFARKTRVWLTGPVKTVRRMR
ncbi:MULTISPECIES: IcmT/TraK family protein [Cupriavidus]